MPRVRRMLTGLALLATTLGACSSATSGAPSASVPVLSGRGGSPASSDPTASAPLPTAVPSSGALSTPVPSATVPDGPLTNLEAFRARMLAFGATSCGSVEPSGQTWVVRCDATDPTTGTIYRFAGLGPDRTLEGVVVTVAAPAGGTVVDGTTATVFENILAAVADDRAHPGIAWLHEHVADIDSSTRDLPGYNLRIGLPFGVTDASLGRELTIYIRPE